MASVLGISENYIGVKLNPIRKELAEQFALCYFINWLNQRAVRQELEPRQRTLQTLLSSLDS